MTIVLAAWFTTGMELHGLGRLAMMLPLCLSIAVVYKTSRCERLREVPLSSLALFTTIVAGMFSVGASLWLLFLLLA